MAVTKIRRFTYWSYSGWSTWVQCAYKAMLKQIEKRQEPGNAAMANGDKVHKEGEAYIKGKVRTVPASFGSFKRELTRYRKLGAIAETTWAFNRQWVRVPWNDWDNVWVRIKVDLHHFDVATKHLYIFDYKTGKDRSEEGANADQMDLYLLGGLLTYPDAQVITTELWYLEHGTRATQVEAVGPRTLLQLKAKWNKNVAPMMADVYFAKSPSRLCGWCHFRQSNGGPCENG